MYRSKRFNPVSMLDYGRTDGDNAAVGVLSSLFFARLSLWVTGMVVTLTIALAPSHSLAENCPSPQRGLPSLVPTLEEAVNPNPSLGDIELPMPCGAKMVLRHVCVSAKGYFDDLKVNLGCENCGRQNQRFMEGKHSTSLSGPLTLSDLPSAWHQQLNEIAKTGDGMCPNPNDQTTKGFYYFIGKYEVSNFQWDAVMNAQCPGLEQPLTTEHPRPKTDISWFEAIDFTRRYTEWLLKNSPDSLPKFSRGRSSYIRLPTEAEWEYAARGGQLVAESQMNHGEFFPLNGRPHTDYAVFTAAEDAKPPEKLARIGSKCSNPLGLFDTAGNATEMTLDPFRFSVGAGLHGAAGGFVVKGGSYRKRKDEIMPGRREEMPYFLDEGAFRATDLGFRVALSAIVTPLDREEHLEQQWWALADGQNKGDREGKTLDKNPISEINQIVANSTSEDEKTNLYFIKDLVSQSLDKTNTMLTEQRARTIKEIIRNALLAAESITNYNIMRKDALDELNTLDKLKTKAMSTFVLQSLDGDISKAQERVGLFDARMDYFLQSYLQKIQESRNYDEQTFENHLGEVFREIDQERIVNPSLNLSMNIWLELFRKHVSQSRNQAAGLNKEAIKNEIVSREKEDAE